MELQTKADFSALMYKFLSPLKSYYSAGCARLHLGETGAKYKQSTIELEGVIIKCDPNTSLYFANVRLPAVKYVLAKGHTVMDTDITDTADR